MRGFIRLPYTVGAWGSSVMHMGQTESSEALSPRSQKLRVRTTDDWAPGPGLAVPWSQECWCELELKNGGSGAQIEEVQLCVCSLDMSRHCFLFIPHSIHPPSLTGLHEVGPILSALFIVIPCLATRPESTEACVKPLKPWLKKKNFFSLKLFFFSDWEN